MVASRVSVWNGYPSATGRRLMKQASTRASDNQPELHLAYFKHNACHADHVDTAVGNLYPSFECFCNMTLDIKSARGLAIKVAFSGLTRGMAATRCRPCELIFIEMRCL